MPSPSLPERHSSGLERQHSVQLLTASVPVAGALAQHGAVPGEAPAPGLLPLQARNHDSERGWHVSVAGAGGRADTGAGAAGVHASDGREVGVVEDRELEGQPALDAAGKGDRVSEGWLLS